MNFKIVTDSSADLLSLSDVPFTSVPLTIKTSENEYIDNEDLNITAMLDDLAKYSGKSGSACPNYSDWKNAFEGAKNIFAITITSGLSGSYNSASIAAKEYKDEHPECNIYVIDTLSTGPESALIIEKLRELILLGLSFDEIVVKIQDYQKHSHLAFSLQCIRNLANNGRVNPAVAKIIGILGIRLVGKASNKGELEMTDKTRGAERAVADVFKNMLKNGYTGGKVRIHHCENPQCAESLRIKILEKFPEAPITVDITRGLCSFYAERGGMLVGYEGGIKK